MFYKIIVVWMRVRDVCSRIHSSGSGCSWYSIGACKTPWRQFQGETVPNTVCPSSVLFVVCVFCSNILYVSRLMLREGESHSAISRANLGIYSVKAKAHPVFTQSKQTKSSPHFTHYLESHTSHLLRIRKSFRIYSVLAKTNYTFTQCKKCFSPHWRSISRIALRFRSVYISRTHTFTQKKQHSCTFIKVQLIHCKKEFVVFPSPAGMSLIKLFLGGNNLIFPVQGEFDQWHPGWGRENG